MAAGWRLGYGVVGKRGVKVRLKGYECSGWCGAGIRLPFLFRFVGPAVVRRTSSHGCPHALRSHARLKEHASFVLEVACAKIVLRTRLEMGQGSNIPLGLSSQAAFERLVTSFSQSAS